MAVMHTVAHPLENPLNILLRPHEEHLCKSQYAKNHPGQEPNIQPLVDTIEKLWVIND